VRGWINDIREQISEMPYNFKALQFTHQIRLYGVVTAGTVTTSANGREVTGASTTWTTTISKPYNAWQVKFDNRFYKIENIVSDTIMVLAEPLPGGDSTAGGASYKAHQKFYPLPYDVQKLWYVKEQQTPKELRYVDPIEKEYYFSDENPGAISTYPEGYTTWGSQDVGTETTYADCVAASSGYTVTCSGESLLDDNLKPGDLFTLSATSFTVNRVIGSDTLLTQQIISKSVTSTAKASNNHGTYIEFSPPTNINDIVTLYGYRKTYPLHGDNDVLEEGWYPAVRAGVIVRGWEYLKRPIAEKRDIYNKAIQQLVRSQVTAHNRFSRIKLRIPRRYTGYF
jgi:hypothetical protein